MAAGATAGVAAAEGAAEETSHVLVPSATTDRAPKQKAPPPHHRNALPLKSSDPLIQKADPACRNMKKASRVIIKIYILYILLFFEGEREDIGTILFIR